MHVAIEEIVNNNKQIESLKVESLKKFWISLWKTKHSIDRNDKELSLNNQLILFESNISSYFYYKNLETYDNLELLNIIDKTDSNYHKFGL